MTTLGIREDFKEEERQGKEKEKGEKEKEDKDEDISDLETKEKEKERATFQKMRVIGLRMNGKEMSQKIGMKAIGPMKMRQHGNPKAGMNGKETTTISRDTSKEKERKERKEKEEEKERKVMDLKIRQKRGDGKGEAKYVNP